MRPGGQGRLDSSDASGDIGQPCPDSPSNVSGAWLRSVPGWTTAIAGLLFLTLAFTAGRYGYHRDELYFIVAGRHPDWGYPDQPPLVPLLAAGWDVLTAGHLWAFRLLPALAVAAVVVIASETCAALGGDRAAQIGTALVTAVSVIVLSIGHLFSTSTFTLLLTALVLLLLIRALRSEPDAGPRPWLAVGVTSGIALQVQTLPAFTLASCLAGLLVAGPRAPLRRPGPYLAALIALVIAAPYLIWQGAHGWPQLEVARSIAAGNSTSSADRWQVIPFQTLMVGPLICVVLVAGVLALLRTPDLRPVRWLGVAYPVLLVLVTATGGKPYYPTGMFPAVLSAGVIVTLRWIGTSGVRRRVAGAVLIAHTVPSLFLCLPLAPAGSPIFRVADAVNPDTGETVGWDRLVAQVDGVVDGMASSTPAGRTVVLTRNYGEAGALDRARREGVDLPPVYSGHNAYGSWGPPPATATATVLVGELGDAVTGRFTGCRPAATIDTGVDNEEDGVPVVICSGLRAPWSQLWPGIRRVG